MSYSINLGRDQFSQMTHRPVVQLQIHDKKMVLSTASGQLIQTEPWNFHPTLWSNIELLKRMRWHVVQFDDGNYQVKWSLRILGGGSDQSTQKEKEKAKEKAELVKNHGLTEHEAELFVDQLFLSSRTITDRKKIEDRIISACSNKYFEENLDDRMLVLKLLIERYRVDPNYKDEIFHSGMRQLLKFSKQKEPIEYMLDKGAILEEELAPLHRALKMGWLDTFELMLQKGANVNECKFKSISSLYGKRILHSIIRKGSIEFLKTLLTYPHVEANPPDEEGCTPLIRACEKEERHVHLPLLLTLPVDYRVCDEAERTALVALVEGSNPENFQKALALLQEKKFNLNDLVIDSITQFSYCLSHFVFADLRDPEKSPWKNGAVIKNIETMLKHQGVIDLLPFEIYMVLPQMVQSMVQATLIATKRDLQKELKVVDADMETLCQQFKELELLILLDGAHNSQKESCFRWLKEKGAVALKLWKEGYRQHMSKELEVQNQKLLQERVEKRDAKYLRGEKKFEEWKVKQAEEDKEIKKRFALSRPLEPYTPPDPATPYLPSPARYQEFRQRAWDMMPAAQKALTTKPHGLM